jgi:hypothetical protein
VKDSYLQQRVLLRPANFPGRELDVRFAMHLQEMAAIQGQSAAAERAAVFQALAQQGASGRQPTIQCSSQTITGNTYTSCQ